MNEPKKYLKVLLLRKVVTPSEAAAAKMDVPHVIDVDGKYIKYLDNDNFNEEELGKLKESELADYSDSQVIAATEFAPAYKIALCKSCGVALEGVAQEHLMTAKSTASSDYKSVVGNWVYKKVVTTEDLTKGDYLELNAIVSVTGNVYSAEVYAVKYDADENKTVTEKATCSSVTLNSASTPRTLTLVLSGLTASTDTTLNTSIVLSGAASGYTVNIDSTPVTMGKQTGYTATLTKSESHTKHSFSVMDNCGLKTFNIHASAGATSDSNLTPGHYLACDGCDVKYLAEECYYMDSNTKTTFTEGTDKTCAACGYKGKTGEYLYLVVTDNTSSDYYLVAKNSVLPFGSETYAFFNGLEEEIEAWTAFENVNINGSGFVMTTKDDALLTFKTKSST